MPYRISYQVNIDWVGAGEGPMSGSTAANIGMSPAGGAQRLSLFNTPGGQNALTFVSGTITTLTNAMAADIAAQMNAAATLARVQAFSTGQG